MAFGVPARLLAETSRKKMAALTRRLCHIANIIGRKLLIAWAQLTGTTHSVLCREADPEPFLEAGPLSEDLLQWLCKYSHYDCDNYSYNCGGGGGGGGGLQPFYHFILDWEMQTPY